MLIPEGVETLAPDSLQPEQEGHPPLRVQVLGPDCAALSPADLRRVFKGRRLSAAWRQRLAGSARAVVACGSRIVGIAAYERTEDEVRVHEFGIDVTSSWGSDEIAGALIEALEVACLAGGARRLVVLPRAVVADPSLRERGYTAAAGCPSCCFVKSFPS